MDRNSAMVCGKTIPQSWFKSIFVREFSRGNYSIDFLIYLDCNALNQLGYMPFFMMVLNFLLIINVYVRHHLSIIMMFNGHSVLYSIKLDFFPWGSIEIYFLLFRNNVASEFIFRSINQVKSAVHYRRHNTESTMMLLLIFTILLVCVLIFYRKALRATIRSLIYRRNGLHSSPSSSNFNQRYQLLTAVVIDDSSSLSYVYSGGKTTTSKLPTSSSTGRLRNI